MVIFLLAVGLVPAIGRGANFVERSRYGSIDWTNRIIEAVGQSTFPKYEGTKPRARSLAKKLAIQKARKNLLSIIMAITMDSGRSVSDFIKGDKERLIKLTSLVKSAELANLSFVGKDTVRVTLSLRFNGPVADLILPDYIKRIRPIIKMGSCTTNPKSSYTGILIDCSEISFKPCLVPRIINEKEEEIFGPAYVSRDCVTREGMVRYVKGPDKRINTLWLGKKILKLKALRVLRGNPNIVVLTNSDAESIRANPVNLLLFHDCKVVFVLGKRPSK